MTGSAPRMTIELTGRNSPSPAGDEVRDEPGLGGDQLRGGGGNVGVSIGVLLRMIGVADRPR